MQSVTFKNRSIDMAGNLYLPPNFDQRWTYAAIVAVHPGGGVKEQVAGLYADLLAVVCTAFPTPSLVSSKVPRG